MTGSLLRANGHESAMGNSAGLDGTVDVDVDDA